VYINKVEKKSNINPYNLIKDKRQINKSFNCRKKIIYFTNIK